MIFQSHVPSDIWVGLTVKASPRRLLATGHIARDRVEMTGDVIRSVTVRTRDHVRGIRKRMLVPCLKKRIKISLFLIKRVSEI